MNKQQAIKAAKSFFERYSDQNSFHITADGKVFFSRGDAILHSKSLEDKSVVEVMRSDCDAKEPVEDEVVKEDVVLIEEKTDADDNADAESADEKTADEVVKEITPAPDQVEKVARQLNKGRGTKKK